jgi:hypothetical protein
VGWVGAKLRSEMIVLKAKKLRNVVIVMMMMMILLIFAHFMLWVVS